MLPTPLFFLFLVLLLCDEPQAVYALTPTESSYTADRRLAQSNVRVAKAEKTTSASQTPIGPDPLSDETRAIEAISGSRVPGTIEHLLTRPARKGHGEHMVINILYPSIGRSDVDSDIRQWVTAIADSFERAFDRDRLLAEIGGQREALNDPIELLADYSISRPSQKALSITFELWNHVGGPHPNLDVITLNYSLINGQRLSLADIFALPDVALKLMSKVARADLQERYGTGRTHMLYRGTEPLIENFSSLTLTPTGISVNFQPYQVASWEMGVQKVDITLEDLAQARPLTALWGK
ncbi:MAG: DUF3298 domain-containing protein [Desulfovibrionaceae bacterium]|nr:DUF3298 domain-containing protein [Desulfovibrionaceae bacterium]